MCEDLQEHSHPSPCLWALHHIQELPRRTGAHIPKVVSSHVKFLYRFVLLYALKSCLSGNIEHHTEHLLCKNITALSSSGSPGIFLLTEDRHEQWISGLTPQPKNSPEGSYRRFKISTQSWMQCQARLRIFCLSRIVSLIFSIYNKPPTSNPSFFLKIRLQVVANFWNSIRIPTLIVSPVFQVFKYLAGIPKTCQGFAKFTKAELYVIELFVPSTQSYPTAPAFGIFLLCISWKLISWWDVVLG